MKCNNVENVFMSVLRCELICKANANCCFAAIVVWSNEQALLLKFCQKSIYARKAFVLEKYLCQKSICACAEKC